MNLSRRFVSEEATAFNVCQSSFVQSFGFALEPLERHDCKTDAYSAMKRLAVLQAVQSEYLGLALATSALGKHYFTEASWTPVRVAMHGWANEVAVRIQNNDSPLGREHGFIKPMGKGRYLVSGGAVPVSLDESELEDLLVTYLKKLLEDRYQGSVMDLFWKRINLEIIEGIPVSRQIERRNCYRCKTDRFWEYDGTAYVCCICGRDTPKLF